MLTRRTGSGDAPDHHVDAPHRDAHVGRGELVLRGGLHRHAELGVAEEHVHHGDQRRGHDDDRDLLLGEDHFADLEGAVGKRRRKGVGVAAPARHHGDEAAQHVADADRDHHHGERGLAEHRPQHETLGKHADRRHRRHREHDGRPVGPAPDHACGEREEAAQHHEVALGEIHRLGRLVDEHETERDQRVDAALRHAREQQLQNLIQPGSSPDEF